METLEGKIDTTKPSIIMDDVLHQYGESLCDHLIQVDKFEDIHENNMKCVCKFDFNMILGNYEMYKLTWGHIFTENSINRQQFHEMAFINNLDSVLDYDDFNLPPVFLFPLLECVRLSSNTKNMYIVGNPPSGMVYVSHN